MSVAFQVIPRLALDAGVELVTSHPKYQFGNHVALDRFMHRSAAGHLAHLPGDQLTLQPVIVWQRGEFRGSYANSNSSAHAQILAELHATALDLKKLTGQNLNPVA